MATSRKSAANSSATDVKRVQKAKRQSNPKATISTRLPVMMRVPADLLERVDAAAKKRG